MRSFLAVTPDAAARERLMGAIARLRGEVGSVRWVREPHLHITLAFLGDVDEARLSSVIEAVRPVVAATTAFRLQVSGGGAFPDWARPRVVWLAFQDWEALAGLGSAVRTACAGAGSTPDGRFTPHLTIGRVMRPLPAVQRDRLREAVSAAQVPHPFEVSRVEVLHSVLAPGGPQHAVVAALPLRARLDFPAG